MTAEERVGVLRAAKDSRLAAVFEMDVSKIPRCSCHKPGRVRVKAVDASRAPDVLRFLKFGARVLEEAEHDTNYWTALRNEAKFQKIPDLFTFCNKFL